MFDCAVAFEADLLINTPAAVVAGGLAFNLFAYGPARTGSSGESFVGVVLGMIFTFRSNQAIGLTRF